MHYSYLSLFDSAAQTCKLDAYIQVTTQKPEGVWNKTKYDEMIRTKLAHSLLPWLLSAEKRFGFPS